MYVELRFPVMGTKLPIDHAYTLYSALSAFVPSFHDEGTPLRFASVSGIAAEPGQLQLDAQSVLRIRLPEDAIKTVLPLAGKRLSIGDSTIRLGVPAVRTLTPAPSLVARIVTFKNADTPEAFLTTARARLAEQGIAGEPQLPIHLEGEHAGKPKRRVICIKGITIPGYSLLVTELSAADSIRLQETGLGGRVHMGCGFFVVAKPEGR